MSTDQAAQDTGKPQIAVRDFDLRYLWHQLKASPLTIAGLVIIFFVLFVMAAAPAAKCSLSRENRLKFLS